MRTSNHLVVECTRELEDTLASAITAFRPRAVIETGTHLGTGTTAVILKVLNYTVHGVGRFHTIEVNPQWYEQAKHLLEPKGVACHLGCSVPLAEALDALRDPWLVSAPDGVARDFADPSMYATELVGCSDRLGGVQMALGGWLAELLPMDRPLVCLDSAGAIGWLEFQRVLMLQSGPILFFLDDANHIKHYRSRMFIENRATRDWRIHGYNEEDGWLIAERLG